MLYHVYLAEPPSLLDDLLEASDRIYHHHCAIIQRMFADEWTKTLQNKVGQEQIEHPNDKPALVEARIRQRLQRYRIALLEQKRLLISEERQRRAARNQAIRAYVASRTSARLDVSAAA